MWIFRRFTVICVLGALVGMAAVDLVQNGARPAYSLKIDTAMPCIYTAPGDCGGPHRN